MKVISHTFLCLIILTFLTETVFCCTCSEYYSPECVRIARTDAVFFGKVEKIFYINEKADGTTIYTQKNAAKHSDPGDYLARFKVLEKYKGEIGETIDVYSYIGSSCTSNASNVKVGDKWTIYSNYNTESKSWLTSTGACSYSFKGNKNTFLQDFKNNLTKETVEGRILKDASWGDGIGNIPVKIEGDTFKSSTTTDTSEKSYFEKSGSFKFVVPKAGKYKVSFLLPSGLSAFSPYGADMKPFPSEKETLIEYFVDVPKGLCDFTQFETYKIDLKATATISGKFISPENKPIPKFYPELCKIAETEEKTLNYSNCQTLYDLSPNGIFEFKVLREGKYVIVTNKDDFPDINMPFLRHYYPGVRSFSDAQIITLEQGQQLELKDFRLPDSIPLVEIRGRLFWKKGVPLTKKLLSENDVYFRFADFNKPKNTLSMSQSLAPNETVNGITLKEDGTFIFQAFQGMKYLMSFSIEDKKGNLFDKKIEISIDKNLKPLEVILERRKD